MWPKNVHYLDHNAGIPIPEPVSEALKAGLSSWGNPSSRHQVGQYLQGEWQRSKQKMARSLGAHVQNTVDSWVITSSGTEASQSVIRSACVGGGGVSDLAFQAQGAIFSEAEHPATDVCFPQLESVLPWTAKVKLQTSGQIDFEHLAELLVSAQEEGIERIFLSLFWVHHETGVILDLVQLNKTLAQSTIETLLHLDAAQAWGKIPINIDQLQKEFGVDYLTFSGSKIGAPSGIGLIWKRVIAPFCPLILGNQENGERGGSENWLGAIAMGVAAECLQPANFDSHTRRLRDYFEFLILQKKLPIRFFGQDAPRVGNTSRFAISGFEEDGSWVDLLDLRGFAVSHGSACQSQVRTPSKLLMAMGASRGEALNSIRVSFGMGNDLNDVTSFVDQLESLISKKARAIGPDYQESHQESAR